MRIEMSLHPGSFCCTSSRRTGSARRTWRSWSSTPRSRQRRLASSGWKKDFLLELRCFWRFICLPFSLQEHGQHGCQRSCGCKYDQYWNTKIRSADVFGIRYMLMFLLMLCHQVYFGVCSSHTSNYHTTRAQIICWFIFDLHHLV